VRVVTDLSTPVWPGERAVVTIGAYDGVHLGHLAVIRQVRALADRLGARSAVVTFDRHPAMIVRPESAPKLLTDDDQRLELLTATGLDGTVIVHFDEKQSQEAPDAFVERVLVGVLGVQAIVVGEDFHFGRHRAGNVALLEDLGRRFDFDVVPLELVPREDGVDEPVSSTAIRRALAGGNVALAATMLGRPYEARGIVVQGDQRGRLLGFPTANVEVPNRVCLPADGVYAGTYVRPDSSVHPAAINLGRRPTFYEHADHSLLEAHLIDFEGDLYGERAAIRFEHFLRSERKFDGIDALVAQLKHDVEHARQLLGAE
jgi:riboflavin kinase / FMN adenylyltransferase